MRERHMKGVKQIPENYIYDCLFTDYDTHS